MVLMRTAKAKIHKRSRTMMTSRSGSSPWMPSSLTRPRSTPSLGLVRNPRDLRQRHCRDHLPRVSVLLLLLWGQGDMILLCSLLGTCLSHAQPVASQILATRHDIEQFLSKHFIFVVMDPPKTIYFIFHLIIARISTQGKCAQIAELKAKIAAATAELMSLWLHWSRGRVWCGYVLIGSIEIYQ